MQKQKFFCSHKRDRKTWHMEINFAYNFWYLLTMARNTACTSELDLVQIIFTALSQSFNAKSCTK